MKPHPPWATLTSTAAAIAMPASAAIGGGARRPDDRLSRGLKDLLAGAWVRAGWREDLPADPPAHPRFARPGPAPSARRTPRPSACPPGSAHSGPTRPHHGRNQKPSFPQEDNSPSWRSSDSRLSIWCVVSGFRIYLMSWTRVIAATAGCHQLEMTSVTVLPDRHGAALQRLKGGGLIYGGPGARVSPSGRGIR